jgi:c-di-GMP-binding flagellar brake protein YcgR
MNRRTQLRQPIRLKVVYRDAKALVAEYTRSVSRGGCSIVTARPLEVGTLFLFHLSTEDAPSKFVEVEGKVVHATKRRDGEYDLGIEYASSSSPRRVATTRFLDQVLSEKLSKRKHARVPVNLVVEDLDTPNTKYLLLDLSRGGFGLRLGTGVSLPEGLSKGRSAELSVYLDGEAPFQIPCAVVRLEPLTATKRQAGIALEFVRLSEANERLVDALLYLHRPQGVFLRFLD